MIKKKIVLGLILIGLALWLTLNRRQGRTETLRFLTHDSFNVSEALIKEFEEENKVKIEFLQGGDTGTLLNTAVLNKQNPVADVLFGIDNTFLSRALEEDLFETYQSLGLGNIREEIRLGKTENKLTPVDYGDVCLNYDKSWFAESKLVVPQSLEDLTKPAYKDLLAVENPASSSPGLAFLLTTIAYFGEDKYLNYWKQLKNNGVKITDGWEEAYWGEFSAASDGQRPLVVSYATSPAAEVYFSEGAYTEPPTGVISDSKTCFRQIEYVGILKGTKNRKLAEKLIDFMLTAEYQGDIPLQMWMFPARKDVEPVEVVQRFAEKVAEPAEISADEIKNNREEWIDAWTEVVLR